MTWTRADFLTALHEGCEGCIELRALPSGARTFLAPADREGVARFASQRAAENVYVGVATRKDPTSGRLENCRHLAALFTDLDFHTTPEAGARGRLARFILPPSAVIHSGGGLHAYWFLREPMTLPADNPAARSLMRRLAHALGGDLAAAEPARVLRLPGTFNRKPKYPAPRPVEIEALNPDRRYNPSEFDEILAPEPTPNGPGSAFSMPEGPLAEGEGRNNTLYRLIRSLRAKKLSARSIIAAVEAENARFLPPLPDDELHALLQHAMTQPDRPAFVATAASATSSAPAPDEPDAAPAGSDAAEPPLTERGNAQRFAHDYTGIVRYCGERGGFLVWDGTRYRPDPGQLMVMALAKQTARRFLDRTLAQPGDVDKRRLKHALTSESAPGLKHTLELARSEPGIPVTVAELDTDPFILNTPSGMVDLTTGALLPHDPARLCTRVTPVAYDPAATCPRFLAFLNLIFRERGELVAYVQRLLGMATTGATDAVLALLHGGGGNGKSTLVSIVRGVLGPDYSGDTPAETLLVKRRDGGIPNDLARLDGLRCVHAAELEGRRLSEATVKQVTGGDAVVARFMRQEFFEYRPGFTLLLTCNRLPRITGTDEAIWRRVHVVPFDVQIPVGEQVRDFAERLVADQGPGILTWFVQGSMAWRAAGRLVAPDDVVLATQHYRQEQDALGPFLIERCALESSARVAVAELYQTYTAWAHESGEPAMSKSELKRALIARGLAEPVRGTRGARTWAGIRVRRPQEPEAEALRTEDVTVWS